MDVKVGDVVHVKATVSNITPDAIGVTFMPARATWYVPRSTVVHVEPRPPEPLKVGDKVRFARYPASKWRGDIVALDGAKAWVRDCDGLGTRSIDDLIRVEPGEFKVGDKVRSTVVSEAGVGVVEKLLSLDRVEVRYPTWYGLCGDEVSTLVHA